MDTKVDRSDNIREQLSRELSLRAEGEAGKPQTEPPPTHTWIDRFSRFFVRDSEVLSFYQELALLLECGMPLVKALHSLHDRWASAMFRTVIGDLASKVEHGKSFSQALADHHRYFPYTIISMVRAGEKSGNLGPMLDQIAERGQKLVAMKRGVISGLIYPAIVLLVAGAVISIVFGILAKGFKIFDELAGGTPWSMKVLLKVGEYFRTPGFWAVLLLVVLGLFILYTISMQAVAMRLTRDRILLSIPLVRHFLKQAILTRFSVVFSTMLRAGVPIQECLQSASDTTNNEILRQNIVNVLAAVRRGERIAGELRKGNVFPPLAYDLCSVAEEAGALDRVFARIATVYEEKQAAEVAMLGKIIQPSIVLIMATVVGFIMYAFFSTYTATMQAISMTGS